MAKLEEKLVEFVEASNSSSRGLLVEVNCTSDPQAVNFNARTKITFSNRWHTTTQVTFNEGDLHLIAVGLLYARQSRSFDITESLKILGRIYREKDVDAVRAAIGGGIFALVIVDDEKRQIHAMCDHLACMPLFYSTTSQSIFLATNQFDLSFHRRLSRDSCLEYISYGYLPYSSSIFEEIDRLGPGQVITVDLATAAIVRLTEERIPSYPAMEDRIQDSHVACRELDRVLTNFFSRLDGAPISAGLSGGYDSRLIAAFTKRYKPYLVTFNYPGTREVITAQRVARLLENSTHIFEIPADAPSRFIDDFYLGMQTLDDLEASHVFALLDALLQGEPSYIIDGYLGDANLGGHYYYKLSGGTESTVRVLSLRDKYEEKKRTFDEYVRMCRSGFGRTIDIHQITGKAFGDFISQAKLELLVSQQLDNCYSHADMIELLKYRFRGRCMIACGPIAFLRRKNTLCPYYDVDLLTTCMSIDKKMRAGEKIYNAFWRYRFPELADVPKESTGGHASQSDIAYRFTHLREALFRRVARRLPSIIIPKNKPGGNIDDFFTRYSGCSTNQDYFNRVFEISRPHLYDAGLDLLISLRNDPNWSRQLYLRLASLATLIAETESS